MFKDSKGREWIPRLGGQEAYRYERGPAGQPVTALLAKIVRAEAQAERDAKEFGPEVAVGLRRLGLMSAFGGISGLAEFLFACVEPQARELRVSREEFEAAIEPEQVMELHKEADAALSDFSLRFLKEAMEKAKAAETANVSTP